MARKEGELVIQTIPVTVGETYSIVVGGGGKAGKSTTSSNETTRYGGAGGSSTAFGVTANGGSEYTDYTGGGAGGQDETSRYSASAGSAGWVKINYDVHSTSTKIDKYALHIDL